MLDALCSGRSPIICYRKTRSKDCRISHTAKEPSGLRSRSLYMAETKSISAGMHVTGLSQSMATTIAAMIGGSRISRCTKGCFPNGLLQLTRDGIQATNIDSNSSTNSGTQRHLDTVNMRKCKARPSREIEMSFGFLQPEAQAPAILLAYLAILISYVQTLRQTSWILSRYCQLSCAN